MSPDQVEWRTKYWQSTISTLGKTRCTKEYYVTAVSCKIWDIRPAQLCFTESSELSTVLFWVPTFFIQSFILGMRFFTHWFQGAPLSHGQMSQRAPGNWHAYRYKRLFCFMIITGTFLQFVVALYVCFFQWYFSGKPQRPQALLFLPAWQEYLMLNVTLTRMMFHFLIMLL